MFLSLGGSFDIVTCTCPDKFRQQVEIFRENEVGGEFEVGGWVGQ